MSDKIKKQYVITYMITQQITRTAIVWARDDEEAIKKSDRFDKSSGFNSNGDFRQSKVKHVKKKRLYE
jgi:L-amino acid N-acyltransferase YncA